MHCALVACTCELPACVLSQGLLVSELNAALSQL